MDLAILREYALKIALQVALKTAKQVALNIKKLYTSEVDDGIIAAFEFALNDWSKHTPTSSDKVRLSKTLEGYIQNATSYEALDADTRAFIDCFKKRLSEQPVAHNYLMMLRADMQAKSEEQNLLEHHKTQESVLDLKSQMEELIDCFKKRLSEQTAAHNYQMTLRADMQAKSEEQNLFEHHKIQESVLDLKSRMEALNMTPQYIRAILKELPLEQGLECTEAALEDMLANGRIHSPGAKQVFLEFVRSLFEHADKISEEAKRLRETGHSYLAENLENIRRVLTGESEQSLTDVHKKYQEQAGQDEIRVLKELIEAAQINFSFGEARKFYERLIELSPTIEHHFKYAYLLQGLNDFDKARIHYEEVLHTLRAQTELDTEVYKPLLAITSNNLGSLLRATNDLKQAQACYEDAIKLYQELSEKNPEAYKPYVAMLLNNLATLLQDANEFKQARAYYEDAIKLYQELSDQNLEAYKPYVAVTLNNIGSVHTKTKDLKQAQSCYENALKLYGELFEHNPEAYKPDMAMTLNNLGYLFSDINDLKQAQSRYEDALKLYRELSVQNPETYKPDVAMTQQNLTLLYLEQGKEEETEKAYQEAHDIYKDLASRHPRAYGIDYARVLVIGFGSLGKPKEYLEEAKEILCKYPKHPQAQELLSYIEELAKG